MRIRVSHATTYTYDTPPTGVTQLLRKTPRNHDGQYVLNWRLDLSQDCLLHQHEDAFGNITHSFTADGPFKELTIAVEGEVDTQDTGGVVAGTLERFPPQPVPARDPAHRGRSRDRRLRRSRARRRRQRHAGAVARAAARAARRNDLRHRPDPHHHHRGGSLQAAARRLPGPRPCLHRGGARGSACRRAISAATSSAATASPRRTPATPGRKPMWRISAGSASIPPTACAPTEAYVRVAVGLDYLGAAPVRGTRYGGGGETLKVAVHVDQAQRQSQS